MDNNEIESQKKAAFKKIDDAYYDRKSPHYKDNERYRWAVESINRSFKEDFKNKKNQ